jgi:hypothetical protein
MGEKVGSRWSRWVGKRTRMVRHTTIRLAYWPASWSARSRSQPESSKQRPPENLTSRNGVNPGHVPPPHTHHPCQHLCLDQAPTFSGEEPGLERRPPARRATFSRRYKPVRCSHHALRTIRSTWPSACIVRATPWIVNPLFLHFFSILQSTHSLCTTLAYSRLTSTL